MEIPDQTGSSTAIADLQKNWNQLKDVDRARAVHKLHQAGTSFRSLAKALNRSESLLRHLNRAAQAALPDRILARQGTISTRELAKRAKAAKALERKKESAEQELQRTEACYKVGDAISEWLEQADFWPGNAEAIINEARWLLASAEAKNQLPRYPPLPPGTPIERTIEALRPPPPDDSISREAWYAEWLVRWVYFALPDSLARHQALGRALDKQIRGPAATTSL